MLVIANTVSPEYLDTVRSLPYRVCDATGYLDKIVTELDLSTDLKQKLHQSLLSSGMTNFLKVSYALASGADIVTGLTLQEAMMLTALDKDSIILYPGEPIPGLDGFPFQDVPDLVDKIEALEVR